ncbi:putative ABC exporter domain-containing protein [Belliella sp. DSM 111904]|uniref:ABC exporter domain-containing protein n=1 Tax=Belliella filtrata TaxID=2923435 RepID=A0ABS9UYG2_9BACT|nr:putative ABC exporter domain-containing protein [Belliella filtrata]MCH7409202.1 putative ABC exporter domain-containing protein [Belliella filtrata]
MNEIKLLFRKDILILFNNIKLILKNPLRLLPYLFVVGYFSFFYFRRTVKSTESMPEVDLDQIQDAANALNVVPDKYYAKLAIIGGLTLIALGVLIFQLFRATKKNISFFTMADVNLLFTSPVSPSNILVYYMIRSILPVLGGSIFFMLYASAQVVNQIGMSIAEVILMGFGLALFVFMLFPLKFLIYTLHTKYNVLDYVKRGVFGLGLILFLMMVIPGVMAEKFWHGMFAWIASPWFDFFPLVGWSRAIILYPSHENIWLVIGFSTVYFLVFGIVLYTVVIHSGYYYEDVLESTKSKEEAKEKVKGKKEANESSMSLNAKKQLDVPDFGFGAKALYWRNYVHSSRQDFHPLFGLYGLGFAGLSFIFAGLTYFDWFSHQVIYFYLLILIFIYWIAGMGRNNVGDLKKPYFILIPATWSAKFWNLIKLDLMQTLIFAVILIVPTVFIAKLSLLLIPAFVLAMLMFYLSGFAMTTVTNVGFEEGWDRKLIKPVMMIGVLLFGFVPAIGTGLFVFIISKQFAYGMIGICVGMALVTGVMLHVAMDLISKIEFKEQDG